MKSAVSHHALSKITDRSKRVGAIEMLITHRIAALDYLSKIHQLSPSTTVVQKQPATEPEVPCLLWMGGVSLTSADLDAYYDAPLCSDATEMMHPADANSGVASSSADALWLEQHTTYWYDLGCGLANLLVHRGIMSGVSLANAASELLLELEMASAPSAAKRAAAAKTLRQLREDLGVSSSRPAVIGPGVDSVAGPLFAFHTSHAKKFPLAYTRVVPALLATLALTYRKLLDFDIADDDLAYHSLLRVDSKLQSSVLDAITEELQKVADLKLKREFDSMFVKFKA